MKPIKEGKVREIYDNGDSLIMVATDRISCFDVILNNVVTKKGTVLTQMSKFWFDLTKDILPNHMISADVKDMPENAYPIRFLTQTEIVHLQRFGEAIKSVQDQLNSKNFYAFNPSYDTGVTRSPCECENECECDES